MATTQLSEPTAGVRADEASRLGYAATAIALVALLSIGVALRLQRAWEDVPKLIVNSVPDDSFYYFQIARNIVRGHNVTLDGETVTNGFHPLWLALITPLFAIDDRELALHLALTVGALFGAATILLVFEITRRVTESPRAALLAAGFFAVHPVIVVYAANGLETSVSLFFIALTTLLFVRCVKAPEATSAGQYVAIGVSSGLMILARTDTALALPAILAVLALRESGLQRWRGPGYALGACAVVLAPWFIWNLAALGTVLQVSGLAGGVLERQGYLNAHGDGLSTRVPHGLAYVRDMLKDDLPRAFLVPILLSPRTLWIVAIVAAAVVTVTPASRRRATFVAAATVSVPFGGLLLALIVEAGVRWFVRPWYFAPYALLCALLLGIGAHWLEGVALDVRDWSAHRGRRGAGGGGLRVGLRVVPSEVVVAGVYAVLVVLVLWKYGPQRDDLGLKYRWQPNVLEASQWLSQNTDPAARVGAYNAGIPAYFSGRTVVNLDGVVNEAAYHAARDCTTRDYVREKRLDLVVDVKGQFFFASCGLDFEDDLDVVAMVGSTPGSELYVLKPKR